MLIHADLDQLAQLASQYSWVANDLDVLLDQLSAQWNALSACWQDHSKVDVEQQWLMVRRVLSDRTLAADCLANWLRQRVTLFTTADEQGDFVIPGTPLFPESSIAGWSSSRIGVVLLSDEPDEGHAPTRK